MSLLRRYLSLVKFSHSIFALPFALLKVPGWPATVSPPLATLLLDRRLCRRRAHRGDGLQPPRGSRTRRAESPHSRGARCRRAW